MHQKRLAARLRRDPLGELTGLPDPLAVFKGRCTRKGELGKDRRGEEGRGKREGTGGDKG